MPDNKKPHNGIDTNGAQNMNEEYGNSVEKHEKIPDFRSLGRNKANGNGAKDLTTDDKPIESADSAVSASVEEQLRDLKKAVDESATGSVEVKSADGRSVLVGSDTIEALLKATEGFQAAKPSESKAPAAAEPGRQQPAAQPQAARPAAGYGNGAGNGANGLSDGVREVAAGAAAVVGGAGALIGGLAAAAGHGLQALVPNVGASLPPRLSDYRGHQIEKAVNAYEAAAQGLWEVPALSRVREAVAEHARVSGISFQDVVAKMGPHGELSDLWRDFNDSLRGSEPGMRNRKAMEKALNTWSKQHEHAEKEALNPFQQDDPSFKNVRERIALANKRLTGAAGTVPLMEGDDKPHLDRIKEVMARVVEMIKKLLAALRGESHDNGPQGP